MGYYVKGEGVITLKEKPTEKQLETLKNVLYAADGYFDWQDNDLYLFSNGKYYESEIYAALDSLTSFIAAGCVKFAGEDGAHWRFVFRNNEWEKENGQIVYGKKIPAEIKEENIIEFYDDVIDAVEEVFEKHSDEWNREDPMLVDAAYYETIEKFDEIMKKWGLYAD